jgi:hypothetical protein
MSLLIRLRQKIEATITNELKPARERLRSTADKNQTELVSIRDELSRRRDEVKTLELATPAELVRRGLTAQEAVAESDKIAKVVSKLQEQESSLADRVSSERAARDADFAVIRKLLPPLVGDTTLLLQAELVALVNAIVDTNHFDSFYHLNQGDLAPLWRASLVNSIMSARKFALDRELSREQLLVLVDQVLVDPIPTLKQAPQELSDDPNANMLQWLKDAVNR